MANTENITENRLRLDAMEARNKTRKVILMVGSFVAVLVGLYLQVFAASVFVLVFVAIWYFFTSADPQILAGARGEEIALEVLKKLPDDYTLFNQVDFPNKKSRTGVNEADLVVLGPKCVFVIEVKHNNSAVSGSESARQWEVNKIGRGGTPYTSSMRNPIAQVKKLVWLLSEELKKRKSRIWLQGVVVFTHDNSSINATGDFSLPVIKLDEMVNYIVSYKGDAKPQAVPRTRSALIEMKKLSTS